LFSTTNLFDYKNKCTYKLKTTDALYAPAFKLTFADLVTF